ncbi:MAG: hypothetical protein MN733_36830 [Nitrososphaera sp.]|nr:hypothetical protein [Nitrososphaera sp.]
MTITLSNLSEATEEQIFQQVYLHAVEQGARSTSDSGCLYRTHDGLKCAAGFLISDEQYKPEFEHKSWLWIVKHCGFPSAHEDFIYSLQDSHDKADSYQGWIDRLVSLGESKGWDLS